MLYSLKRIFHNLKRFFPIYLLFIIQFTVGILIFCGTLNVLFTMKEDLKEKKQELANEKAIEITANVINYDSEEEVTKQSFNQCSAVSYDLYLKLKEKYKDSFNFQYAVNGDQIVVFAMEQETGLDAGMSPPVSIWFVNDKVFETYFHQTMDENTIYAGENAYDVLLQIKEWVSHPEKYSLITSKCNTLSVKDGEFILGDKKVYQLATMPFSEKTEIKASIPDDSLYNGFGEDYFQPTLSDCIFIPLSGLPIYEEFYNSIQPEERDGISNYPNLLKVQYKNSDFEIETISNIISDLQKGTHINELEKSVVTFTMNERILSMQEFIENIKSTLIEYIVMSISVLLVVLLGSTGLFLIFLYRRKKLMAISIAYGSTKRRLFWELFVEILTITGSGSILGLSLQPLIRNFFQTLYVGVEFQASCIVITMFIAIGTAFITALLAFMGVGEIAPAKLLKEL